MRWEGEEGGRASKRSGEGGGGLSQIGRAHV